MVLRLHVVNHLRCTACIRLFSPLKVGKYTFYPGYLPRYSRTRRCYEICIHNAHPYRGQGIPLQTYTGAGTGFATTCIPCPDRFGEFARLIYRHPTGISCLTERARTPQKTASIFQPLLAPAFPSRRARSLSGDQSIFNPLPPA